MTGPEHFREAERLLVDLEEGNYGYGPRTVALLAHAQVHATLALAAATDARRPRRPLHNQGFA